METRQLRLLLPRKRIQTLLGHWVHRTTAGANGCPSCPTTTTGSSGRRGGSSLVVLHVVYLTRQRASGAITRPDRSLPRLPHLTRQVTGRLLSLALLWLVEASSQPLITINNAIPVHIELLKAWLVPRPQRR